MVTQHKKPKGHKPTNNLNNVWHTNPDIVRRFIEQRPDYEHLCTEVAYILEKRLRANNIEFSAVTWRTKTLSSFLEKIERKKYSDPFSDITDFAGVRAVCLYTRDISAIESAIQDEFEIKERVDKITDKGTDRFGYGALHFIVKLSRGLSGARYDGLKGLVCEVQVRTVVQDAWAIISHHLLYKNESDVPAQLQRDLNALAASFETADKNFVQIREKRAKYLASVRRSQSDSKKFLANELNRDSFDQYLQWKFPDLPKEYFKGQIDAAFGFIKKKKYPKLIDLDVTIDKASNLRERVMSEFEALGHSHLDYAAAQALLSLALVDKAVLRSIDFTSRDLTSATLKELVQKANAKG